MIYKRGDTSHGAIPSPEMGSCHSDQAWMVTILHMSDIRTKRLVGDLLADFVVFEV